MNNEEIIIEFKPHAKDEVLLKYYRGYPISYSIYGGGYRIIGQTLNKSELYVTKSSDPEITKRDVDATIKSFEKWIDTYIEDHNLIMDIAKGNYVPQPIKPVEVRKKESWIKVLLGIDTKS